MRDSRVIKLLMDVPPSEFVSVMRRKVCNMLQTIIEEETGTNVVEGHTSSLKGSSHSSAFSRESYKISVCGQE
ncbi:hypothetical protein ACHQM5_017959 [Ranunculus cassubicifolius]